MKRDKSIIQKDLTKCLVCGTTKDIHIHEVFFGSADRKKSIKWGLYVALCAKDHNMSKDGVHFNKALDLELKKLGQKCFEKIYGYEKFIQEFKKNYL